MRRNPAQVTFATTLLLVLVIFGCPNIAQSHEKPKVHSQNSERSLPKVFVSVLPQVKAKSQVPVLLPSKLPEVIATAKHSIVQKAAPNEYAISLYYELGVGDAGFAAFFSAEGNPKFDPRKFPTLKSIDLAHRLHGFFGAVSCGGSCAPANLWWEQNDILYQIQLELSPSTDDQEQERIIVAAANSAILAGPR